MLDCPLHSRVRKRSWCLLFPPSQVSSSSAAPSDHNPLGRWDSFGPLGGHPKSPRKLENKYFIVLQLLGYPQQPHNNGKENTETATTIGQEQATRHQGMSRRKTLTVNRRRTWIICGTFPLNTWRNTATQQRHFPTAMTPATLKR